MGLKTGSTDAAKYCVSAVAERDGLKMIAVVMGAPDHRIRFQDAAAMLDYGFGSCRLYVDEKPGGAFAGARGGGHGFGSSGGL